MCIFYPKYISRLSLLRHQKSDNLKFENRFGWLIKYSRKYLFYLFILIFGLLKNIDFANVRNYDFIGSICTP